jgi:hypothetical protein
VEYLSSNANDQLIPHPDSGADEPDTAASAADYAGPPLPRLSPRPFRSLGGYFDYEGWSDRQRFLELDEALRRKAA